MRGRVAKLQRAEVEQALRDAGCIVVDPRTVRRVIKQHRDVAGIVPHGRCYTIGRDALLSMVGEDELGVVAGQLPERVILVARPSPRELNGRDRGEVMTRVWRTVFHARVHQALDARVSEGGLGDAEIRRRIDAIGQTEFDEIRAILRHDDVVLPPADEREVYIEFAALYLELRHFAPALLVTTFPGVAEHERVMETLSLDVDVAQLLSRDRPTEVVPPASTRQLKGTSMPSFSAPASFGVSEKVRAAPVSGSQHARILARAQKMRDKGNDVRAALLAMRAASVEDADKNKEAEAAARAALFGLGKRLNAALEGQRDEAKNQRRRRLPEWTSLTMILADRAAAELLLGYGAEARLLFELQRAAVAFERMEGTVDVASWVLTLGRMQVVRALPATRELRVARRLRAAAAKVRHVRVGAADRKLLAKLLAFASDLAEDNVRVALKPRIDAAFDEVKLFAESGPERLARDKIVEELLDRIIDGGYLTFDGLRDALSRNMLKLDDLSGIVELWRGDTLLSADKALAVWLDGIYRRGDVYLRWLQKFSSVPFGTQAGRAITLFVALPLGVAYVVLEGIGHMVNPALGWVGVAPIHPLGTTSFIVTALVVFALIHSAPFRAFAKQLLEVVAWVLATLFLRGPRALIQLPPVRRWFGRPGVRFALRRILVPGCIAAGVYLLSPGITHGAAVPVAVAAVVFVAVSLVMGSRVGAWAEDFVFDQVAPTWHVLSRQWLPGMLRLISRAFSAMMELLLRGMYGVDEWLRFREGQSGVMKLLKGVAGLIWAAIAYLVRIFVTLLVEPFVNPLKHFPTVTVADKLMLQWFPAWIMTISGWLSPLGPVIAGAIATVLVFLAPSVFGFLAWELKENYKLYRATRPESMPPAPVGPDGETMRALLVVGLHSGTLPKLYERLRRAAQREDDAGALLPRKSTAPQRASGLGRFREGLARVEESVRRFVARELTALLQRCPRWSFGDIVIDSVDLSSNRVRVELRCPALGEHATVITIEEQSGYVVAGIASPGFLPELSRRSELGLRLFENALAGFYQRAEVDLVREQLEAELGPTAHYDLTDEGLLVWPGSDYRTELLYRIDAQQTVLAPDVRGEPLDVPLRVLDPRRMFYRDQSISWLAWVTAWSAAEHPSADVPRLLGGVSLIPSSSGGAPG